MQQIQASQLACGQDFEFDGNRFRCVSKENDGIEGGTVVALTMSNVVGFPWTVTTFEPTDLVVPILNAEHQLALQYAREVEIQIMEAAQTEYGKPIKMSMQPIGRLIEYIRNGKTHDVTLSL